MSDIYSMQVLLQEEPIMYSLPLDDLRAELLLVSRHINTLSPLFSQLHLSPLSSLNVSIDPVLQ